MDIAVWKRDLGTIYKLIQKKYYVQNKLLVSVKSCSLLDKIKNEKIRK